MEKASPNFGFLAEHDPLFADLATAAEQVFSSDPNSTLIKLRQLGEALAQHLAALSGIEFDDQTSQSDLLYRLNRELRLEPQVKELFTRCELRVTRRPTYFAPVTKRQWTALSWRENWLSGFTDPLVRRAQASSPVPLFHLPIRVLS